MCEEPGAGKPHAGICAGAVGKPAVLRLRLQNITESDSSRENQVQCAIKGKSQIGRMIGDLASLPQTAVLRLFFFILAPLREDNDDQLVMNSSRMSFLMIQRKA